MTDHPHPTRRRVLELAAGAAALGLAGCLGAPASAADQGADGHDDEPHGHDGTEAGDHEATAAHADDDHEHTPTEHASGHGHSHEETVSGPSHAATVEMTSSDAGEHFEPHVSWVEVGGSVTFVNESGAHSATAYHPDNDRPLLMPEDAEAFDSGMLAEAGAEFTHTFDVEGVYHVFCAPHESLGMLGSVIVGEPDPHDEPALGEVPGDLPGRAPEKLEHLNEKCNEALGHEH